MSLHPITQWVRDTATLLGVTGRPPAVREELSQYLLLIVIAPDPRDVGPLLGQGGATIEALRTLSRKLGEAAQRRVVLKADLPPRGGAR